MMASGCCRPLHGKDGGVGGVGGVEPGPVSSIGIGY